MARLHHEKIGEAARSLALTHGIYGAGSNWRGIAKKLVARRPDWSVILVDLRQHGRSEPGEPPHTIAACAADIAALATELPFTAIAGHSFGGKVMLAARPSIEPVQTWVLDASPSARPGAERDPDNSVARVLALMERLPRTWARREDFAAAVMADGFEPGLANWLAMNVVGEPPTLRLDLAAIRELLVDYYRQDLWPAVLAPGGDVELVLATRSAVLSAGDRERLAHAPPHVHVHEIAAGHWLHIDAPGAIVDLFADRLPGDN